ncbi:cytochrome P450 [Jimgerdemannia flammicorona]|uniref:Cytochrome P450 n=1 Tax=Jimgerdemannia flammicorona TaxID=994334 RepID=A0A433D7Z3_9FUNG|nr:cytochrome P450 [Jimgerdemannia flammicorona]
MAEVLNTLTSLEWCSTSGALVAAAAAATGVYAANRLLTPEDKEAEKFKKLNKLPSPSGALPIVGHLFAVGMSPHIQFSEWSKTLGPIFSVKMGSSRTWIIHNSPEVTREIIDRRGANYSDRASTDILEAASANGAMFGFGPNGPYLRLWRKHTNNSINKLKLEEYSQAFVTQSKQLLLDLLKNGNVPEGINPSDEVYLYSVGSPRVELLEDLIALGNRACDIAITPQPFSFLDDLDYKAIIQIGIVFRAIAGNFTLEFFPFLAPLLRSHVRRAENMQLQIQQLFGKFVEEVRQARKDGNEIKCACSEFLKAQETDKESGLMEDISGLGTSTTALLNCMSILANYPNVQERAFAEIKDNIGLDRLPRDTDEERLPYVRAILTELLRFRPPLWLGLPHTNPKDEEYKGYHIP